jgi:hypothetical protein
MAPTENKFALQLEPSDKITFSGPELDKYSETVTLKLKNTASERLAYKVKCTSNAHFRIRPPVGLVEAGSTADVQVRIFVGIDKNGMGLSFRQHMNGTTIVLVLPFIVPFLSMPLLL